MKLSKRRLPKRRSTKPCLFKPRFEALELRHLLSGSPLPFDDSGLAPAGLQAICALPNLPVFNVHNYGAVGNGVADDTVAIRAALSAAEANGGGIIYLPAGTYDVDPQAIRPSGLGGHLHDYLEQYRVHRRSRSGDRRLGDAPQGLRRGTQRSRDELVRHWETAIYKIGRFSMFSVDSSASGADISTVQFRSLDINGHAGYTGDSEVGGDPTTGDGWDMTNKGIMHERKPSYRQHAGLQLRCRELARRRDLRWRRTISWQPSTSSTAIFTGPMPTRSVARRQRTTRATRRSAEATAGDDVYNGVENYTLPWADLHDPRLDDHVQLRSMRICMATASS